LNLSDTDLNALSANIRHSLTWSAICEHYLRRRPKKDFRSLLEELQTTEQLIAADLAHILRQHNTRPGDLAVLGSLLAQARVRKTDETRMRFIQQGLANSHTWYLAQIEASAPPLRDIWQTPCDQLAAIEAKFSAILAQSEQ